MNWKEQLRLSLDWSYIEQIFPTCNTCRSFPVQITPHYAQLLSKNLDTSLNKIVLPAKEEKQADGSLDSMNENADYKIHGLQHRYPDTVLLMVSEMCASHCRFCFRRRIFDSENFVDEKIKNINDIVFYLKAHTEINNVLLSGGDPFVNSNEIILNILEAIININHIKYVRIGTKILAYLPQRITEEPEFISKLKELNKKKPILIVTHFDHYKEVSTETIEAIRMFNCAGLKLLSQTTLLKGINDNVETMKQLFETFIAYNIFPYYIFQTMPAKGATHYQVKFVDAIKLINDFSINLSGLGKSFRYIIPHNSGKIEAIGYDSNYFYFKYHRSRDPLKTGKLLKIPFDLERVWFEKEEIIFL